MRGKPCVWSRPLTSILISSSKEYTEPIWIFTSSAVVSPIIKLYFFLKYWIMQSVISSPAISMEFATTIPPREITATSVVPPPISTIILACGSVISRPAPIADAIGSSIKITSLAPACFAASSTARRCTSVVDEGIPITMRGLSKDFLLLCTVLIK